MLRNTCATHLLDEKTQEVDIEVFSRVLGHASVKITYDKYIHTDNFHTTNVLNALFNFS